MSTPERQPDERSIAELEEDVRAGRLSYQQLDDMLQARARREAAARRSTRSPRHRLTVEGFGSGQGMGVERSGNEPGAPDEEGRAPTKDPEWPT